jgi:hypothetical protein
MGWTVREVVHEHQRLQRCIAPNSWTCFWFLGSKGELRGAGFIMCHTSQSHHTTLKLCLQLAVSAWKHEGGGANPHLR